MNRRTWKFILITLCSCLIFSGCGKHLFYHDNDYEYDNDWSFKLLHNTGPENGSVWRVEVYSNNTGGGFPLPHRDLKAGPLLWETEDEGDIASFFTELRKKMPRPPNVTPGGNDETFHFVWFGVNDKLGYTRCLWNSQAEKPYGFVISPEGVGTKYNTSIKRWLETKIAED